MVICELSTVPRLSRLLKTEPALNQAYGGPLLGLALKTIQRVVPDLQVKVTSEPQTLKAAWVQNGLVTLNTAYARADALLHEFSHVVIAAVRSRPASHPLRQQYEQLAQRVYGTDTHRKVAQQYPIGFDYTMEDQLDETVNQLLGLALSRQLRVEAGLTSRLREIIAKGWEWLSGKVMMGTYTLDSSLAQLVTSMASDLQGKAGEGLGIEARDLAHLLAVARDLRVDLPATTGELLTRLSGRREGKTEEQFQKEAQDYLDEAKAANRIKVRLPNLLGGSTPVNVEANLTDIINHLKLLESSRKAALVDNVFTLFNLPHETRMKAMFSESAAATAALARALPTDGAAPGVIRQMATELGKVVPDLQAGDQVVRYTQAEMDKVQPGLYRSDLDTGNILVAVLRRPDGKGGEQLTLRLIATTAEDLTEKNYDKPLLHGEFGKSWWGLVQGWGAEHFAGLDLTGSAKNRRLLESTALAMHLAQQNVQVDGVAVAKLSFGGKGTGPNENDVRLTPIGEYLDAWKGLLRLPRVKALLAPDLLALLTTPGAADKKKFERDYVGLLRSSYTSKNAKLRKAFGDYYAACDAASSRGLIEAIETRMNELQKKYEKTPADYVASKEVVALGRARMELAGVRQLLNRHKDIGPIERLVRQWNAGDNPVFQWLYQEILQARKTAKDLFLNYQSQRKDVFNALMDDFHQHEGAFNPVYHDEGKYYEALMIRSEHTVMDKKGNPQKVWIAEHRLKMPGSTDYQKLRPAQRAAIDFMLSAIKQTTTERYQLENPKKTATEVQQWYDSTWGHGYLPIIPGSAKRALGVGDWDESGRQIAEGMLTENYLYDRQDNTNKQGLSDLFGSQADDSPHGSEYRLKMLGYQAIRAVNQKTGIEELTYQLDSETGVRSNLLLEPDLRKSLDQFSMSYAKHRTMNLLQVKKLTALAMIRAGFKESSLLRGTLDELDPRPDETASRTEQDLNIMFNALVLSQHTQGDQSPGTRKASLVLGTLGKFMTYGALGLNIKTAAASLGANFFTSLATGLASWGTGKGLSISSMNQAYGKMFGADRNKLMALCSKLDAFKMDEFDLLHDRLTNGEGIRAFDGISEAFIMDRFGDMGVRMWLTAAQLIQDGTWDVYSFHEESNGKKQRGILTYDEKKHRELKGDVVVNAIRDRQIITGELKAGQSMQMGHDDRMRTTIEAWTSDIMGPYKEEVDGVMGAMQGLRYIKKFRTHIVGKINRMSQERHINENNGYYDNESGEWVGREEVGIFRTLAAVIGGVTQMGFSTETLANLSQADLYNLNKLASSTALAALLMVLSYAIFGDDEDQSQKTPGLGQYVLQSIVQDVFIVNQLKTGVQSLQSPLIVLDFWSRMAAATSDLVQGNVHEAGRVYMRNLGPAKTWNMLAGMYDSATE